MIKKIAVTIVLLMALASTAYSIFAIEVTRANSGKGDAIFEIQKGESVQMVARRLHQMGIISSSFIFKLESRLQGVQGKIKAGEYLLARNLPARSILQKLINGKSILHKVTIPEGFTLKEIANEMETRGLMTAQAFIVAASDPEVLAEFGLPSETGEGFLFPETYSFPKTVLASEVVRLMIKLFFEKTRKIIPENITNDRNMLLKIVILASIIEKETGTGHERKIISAVFRNRLKKGMRLQSDPTVIYAIPNFDGNIRKKDLGYDSPYNTYLHKGLPPGPIASPGLASIKAAISPDNVDYLYFVAKNNGEHHFSRTLREHNNAVKRYQLRR